MTQSSCELWSKSLEHLRLQMPKVTFETWLQKTTARLEGNRLIVLAESSFAQDWLENRLRPTIEQTVAQVAGRPVFIEFQVSGSSTYQPELFLSGMYRDAYNAIVQPDKQHYCSRYYHQKWLPLLGPELWLLIWEMRTRCSWDWKTGAIRRDTFEATYSELAAATGMTRNKVWRLLHPNDPAMEALVKKFVINQETKRRFSKGRGGMVNDKTVWRIRLDDPLTPEDEARLQGL